MTSDRVPTSEKYAIIRELGRGGMGIVYLAEDVLLKRTVAIKMLYEHLNRDSNFVRRFKKEAQSVSSLRHPNIVFVHGLEIVGDTFLIDMEYVDGISLDALTRLETLEVSVAISVAADILRGLIACHNVGVIHRDIKPANILLDQNGVAKIADFGLATAYAGHLLDSANCGASSGFFMGTPRYAPPAAWDGFEPIPEWDLYALGVLLFEMLTRQIAYPGETPMAIMRQHLTEPLPSLAAVTPELSPKLCALVDALVRCKGHHTGATAKATFDLLEATPEYAAIQERETTKTITVALQRRRVNKFMKSLTRRLRPWAYPALLFCCGAGTVFLFAMATGWGNLEGVRPQYDVVPLPENTSMLGTSVTFLQADIVGGSDGDEGLWMVSPAQDGASTQIVGLYERGLWQLALSPQEGDGHYAIQGHWAESLTPANGSFRYGTLSGSGLLDAAGQRLSLALDRVNERDNAKTTHFVVASPVDYPISQRQFVAQLESSRDVQRLLYRELLPRQLPWAQRIEALMPGFSAGRVTVAPGDAAIKVDGILDEPIWLASEQHRDGQDPASDAGAPTVQARWSAESLMLSFSAAVAVEVGEVIFELTLAPGGELLAETPRQFSIAVDASGLVTADARSGARELPWTSDWEVATTLDSGRWQAELRIPSEKLGALAAPEIGQRWRLNARLKDVVTDEALAQWGVDDLAKVEHGMMLVFTGDGQ